MIAQVHWTNTLVVGLMILGTISITTMNYLVVFSLQQAVWIQWNGMVDWNGGMEWWTGMVEWNGGMKNGVL